MSDALEMRIGQPWKKPPLVKSPFLRWTIIIGSVVYLVLALNSIDVNWTRVARGLERGQAFIVAFAHPDFFSRANDIRLGLTESAVMTLA